MKRHFHHCLVVVFIFLLVTSFSAVCIQPVSAAYDATIWAWDSVHGWLSDVPIYESSGGIWTFTGFYAGHTFSLTGTHYYQVPSIDSWNNPFIEWSTGETSTLVVTQEGTYTARYYELYTVSIWSFLIDQGWFSGVPITMDGVLTSYTTGHDFTDLHGTHTFSVPSTYNGNTFSQWDTGETSTTITVSSGGTHTAQYSQTYTVSIWSFLIGQAWLGGVPIYMDGVLTSYTTGHDFTGLTGIHTFGVPSTYNGYTFSQWDTGETSTTIWVGSGGTHTAQYSVPPLTVSITPGSVTMDVGQSQLFTATASGGSGSYTSYQWWSRAGSGLYIILIGQTSSTLNYGPVTTPGSYSIAVDVTDSFGSTSPLSSPAYVTVNSALSTPSASASPGAVYQGQSSTLSVTGLSGGTTPYYYQWLQMAPGAGSYSAISGATSSTYVFYTSGSTATGSWSFELQVTDSASSPVTVTSNAASVTVNSLLVPSVSVTPGSWTMDTGQSKTFTASASGGSGSYSSYQWYVDGVAQSGATSTFDYAPASAGSHSVTVTVTDSLGSTSPQSSAASVIVNSALVAPTVSASAGTVDQGQTSSLTSTAVTTGTSPYTYQWLSKAPGASSFTNIAGATSSSYSFATTTSTATGSWSFELQVTDSTGAQVTSSAASVTVNSALNTPSASASPGTVNPGQSSTLSVTGLSGGTTPYTYQWLQKAPGAGSYSAISGATSSTYVFSTSTSTATGSWSFQLQVTDSASSAMTATSSAASVTVGSGPTVSVSPVSWTMDVGQSKLFTATAAGGSGSYVSYQWYVGGVAVSGQTASTFTYSAVSAGSFSITVTVTDSLGSTSPQSSAASVTVNSALVAPTASASPGTVSQGQSSSLTVSAVTSGTSPYTYQWFSETPGSSSYSSISGATSSSYNFATSTSTAAGSWSFVLQVTDGTAASMNTTSATVVVNAPTVTTPPPTVTTPPPTVTTPPPTVTTPPPTVTTPPPTVTTPPPTVTTPPPTAPGETLGGTTNLIIIGVVVVAVAAIIAAAVVLIKRKSKYSTP